MWRELNLPSKHGSSRIFPLLFDTASHRGHSSPKHLPVSPFPVGQDEVSVLLTMLNILQG